MSAPEPVDLAVGIDPDGPKGPLPTLWLHLRGNRAFIAFLGAWAALWFAIGYWGPPH